MESVVGGGGLFDDIVASYIIIISSFTDMFLVLVVSFVLFCQR